MNADALEVSKNFSRYTIKKLQPLGNGLINDTYLVFTQHNKFVLQRINPKVFPQPSLIMENLLSLNQHIDKKFITEVRLKTPKLIQSLINKPFHLDDKGNYWRAQSYINQTSSKETIDSSEDAYDVGSALGHFHKLLNTANCELFHDTLPGFHITPEYYQSYQSILKTRTTIEDLAEIKFCKKFITDFEEKINILEDARQQGLLIDRIIHGDPKLNNFLFDNKTGHIVSLIDLDTVKPGLIHYDIADCLRSCCHIKEDNCFDFELCQIILKGYIEQAGEFLTEQDYQYLYPAIELIPFELGLRFFTDYLQGNRYFKVSDDRENLGRAINQFQLSKNIEKQRSKIEKLIAEYQKTYNYNAVSTVKTK